MREQNAIIQQGWTHMDVDVSMIANIVMPKAFWNSGTFGMPRIHLLETSQI